MRLLLDTHILIWAAEDVLPPAAGRYVNDRSNTLLFSPDDAVTREFKPFKQLIERLNRTFKAFRIPALVGGVLK